MNKVSKTLDEVKENAEEAKKKINQAMSELREEINLAEAKMISGIEEIRTQKEKELKIQKEELEFDVRGMEVTTDMVEKMLEEGNEVEIAMERKQFLGRAETLLKRKFQEEPVQDPKIEVKEEKFFEDMRKRIKWMGEILQEDASPEHSEIIREGWREKILVGERVVVKVQGKNGKGKMGARGKFQVLTQGPAPLEVPASFFLPFPFFFSFFFSHFLNP